MGFTIPDASEATFPAQAGLYQTDIDALAAGSQGTGVESGCAVTAQGSPDMTLAVASGVVRVAGVAATVSSGNVTVTAANATNPRFDLVVASNTGVKSVIAGTAAAAPIPPTLPSTSVLLATVWVPANDTAINSNQIVDKRVMVKQYPEFAANGSQNAPSYSFASDVDAGMYLNTVGDLRIAIGSGSTADKFMAQDDGTNGTVVLNARNAGGILLQHGNFNKFTVVADRVTAHVPIEHSEQGSVPSIPESGFAKVYVASNGMVGSRNDAGADVFSDFRRIRGTELNQWRSALANREQAPANVYLVGDSMSEGYGQSAFSKTWFDIFRDALQREYRNGGEGFNGVTLSIPTFTHPWTIQNGDQTDYGWGFGRRAMTMSQQSPSVDFISRNFYGDRIYVIYTTSSVTGTMKITLDGVVSTQNTNDPITQSGRVWDSGQLALGTHTLRLEPNADENIMVVDGVMVFATDTLVGVHTFNGAHSGYQSLFFSGVAGNGSDEFWADMMFQPHTRVASGTNGITGNGTTTVTFTGANFTSDDIGEVIYAGTDSAFPRGVRIVSVTNSTTVVVNKTVPSATYTGYFTRSRVTDAVRTNASTTFTSTNADFNQWDRGKTVSGTGIPTGTVIRRVVSENTVILSNPASSGGSGGTLQIKNRQKYPMRPHLLMIQLGINDMQGWVTKANFKTNMQNIETTCIEQAQLDLPGMTGIYTDEAPSIILLGLWAPSHTLDNGGRINTTNGSNVISDATGYANRFNAADIGKTITSVGNTPIPAGTTITGVQSAGTAPGTYTQATISNNALATQAGEDPSILARTFTEAQWYDFRAAMYELAAEQVWALYDLYNLGGYIGQYDYRGLTYDLLHPNDQGAQWIADEMSVSVGGVKKLASVPLGMYDAVGEMVIGDGADRVVKKPGIKRKLTADTASGTTAGVMVDITEFAFTIGPNETVSFLFSLAWTAAATTSGILFDFNPAAGVSAPADLLMTGWGPNGTTGATTSGQWYGRQDAVWGTDLTIPSSITNATTIPSMILISGSVTAGAVGGLITPRFGPEANAATTLQRGSWALLL